MYPQTIRNFYGRNSGQTRGFEPTVFELTSEHHTNELQGFCRKAFESII